MKEKALASSDTSLDPASRAALNTDFKALRDQITKSVNNATFNGINMIQSGGTTIAALANDAGTSKLTVIAQDLSLGGANLAGLSATSTINTQAGAAAMVATLNTDIGNVSAALAQLGTGSKTMAQHFTFIGKLQDSIDAGVGNLVDADLAKESARLTSLQTKQQLGIQALSIANQSSNVLLGLFR